MQLGPGAVALGPQGHLGSCKWRRPSYRPSHKVRVNVNTTDATIEPVLRHCYYPLRILRVLP
jgi:hypothetical protein